MNRTQLLFAGTFAFALTLLGGQALAEGTPAAQKADKGKAATPTPPKGDEAAMMAAAAKYTEPNENHQKLKAMAGSWNVTSRMWMGGPNTKPMESKGTAEKRMILNNRFLQEDFKGTVMGKPFTGQGLVGYDNAKQKFVSTWADNMSTAVTVYEGKLDASGKEMVVSGSSFCPMEQKEKTYRMVTHIENDKKHTMEAFEAAPDGKEIKTMEIVYTRKP